MPEGHALRQISWQLFVTLTFRDPPLRPRRLKLLFAFLREVADADPNLQFRDLLWCVRWEKKLPDGLGHYHLCVAGGGPNSFSPARQHLSEWWRLKTGAIADVQPYVDALDGIGYVLKLPTTLAALQAWKALERTHEWDELQPTLSDSIYRFLRGSR